MKEHTPTPWYVEKGTAGVWITADSAKEGDIADMYHYVSFTPLETFQKDNAEANAKFIVHAVNCHDELVNAATEFRDLVVGIINGDSIGAIEGGEVEESLFELSSAIDKAKEEGE